MEVTMNLIKQLLSTENILLNLIAANKEDLFAMIGDKWEQQYHIPANKVIECLTAREKLGSTGLGKEIAIPHARLKGLDHPVAALVRLRNPIEFDAPDGNPVMICFVLIVPEHATEEHLQILSNAAEILANPHFREKLELATSADEVSKLIQRWEPESF
jgi:PTS system nitrogen regulatory IIA component